MYVRLFCCLATAPKHQPGSGRYLLGGLLPRPPPEGLPVVLGPLGGLPPPLPLPPLPPPLAPPPQPPRIIGTVFMFNSFQGGILPRHPVFGLAGGGILSETAGNGKSDLRGVRGKPPYGIRSECVRTGGHRDRGATYVLGPRRCQRRGLYGVCTLAWRGEGVNCCAASR